MKKMGSRVFTSLFHLLLLASIMACYACSSGSDSTPPAPVETSRDDKGVWFVSGGSLYDAYEASGYAVATDRLWQAELFRRTARGRMAEIIGSSMLEADMYARTNGYTQQELESGFNALRADIRDIIQAYADGFNRRIAQVRQDDALLPVEFSSLGFQPEDWTVYDILAWSACMLRNFDPEGGIESDVEQINNLALLQQLEADFSKAGWYMFNDLRWTNDPAALTYIDRTHRALSQPVQLQTLTASGYPNLKETARRMKAQRQSIVAKLKSVNAYIKGGSYAWAVAGRKTASGNPMIYSGPQMGFSVPAIISEGAFDCGEYNISGMNIAGLPGIVIGRTPHHAWSMQVGHAHTVDYYLEDAANVMEDRQEVIHVSGEPDVVLTVYKTSHGPVISPLPYQPGSSEPIISWKYAQWGYEFETIAAFFDLAMAQNMDAFGEAIERIGVSQHFCYVDRDGNIAYWMSGRDPVRAAGTDMRLPQPSDGSAEWPEPIQLKPRSTSRNAAKGYYCGWNNKSNPDYDNAPNSSSYFFGPFDRAHVVDEYLAGHDNLTFEEIRDLALNISATDSFDNGGNPWQFAAPYFVPAVNAAPTDNRLAALALLDAWDGHFVAGGPAQWARGTDRADAWMLMDAWLREAIRLTFEDELGVDTFEDQSKLVLFNVMLHGLAGQQASIVNNYDWFSNLRDPNAPQTADAIIVQSLDTVLDELGPQPWGIDQRGEIEFNHPLLQAIGMPPVHTMPFASRSTYAHVIEFDADGPTRIESMFPLGQSGFVDKDFTFDPNFFSMSQDDQGNPIIYDLFQPRDFPLFVKP